MTRGGAISVPPEHRGLRRKVALAYREAMTEGLSINADAEWFWRPVRERLSGEKSGERRRGDRVRRRDVLAGSAAAALLTTCPAAAQDASAKTPRIGILTPADTDQTAIFEAFRQGLRDLGYQPGRSVILDFQAARGDYAVLPKLAAEIVALPVDVILTDGVLAARAAMDATASIPIVMGTSGVDPVALGLVTSLARPGRNVTGFTLMHSELMAKRLEVLHTAFPNAAAITVLLNPYAGMEPLFRALEAAARAQGVMTLHRVEAASADALRTLRPEVLAAASVPVLVLPDATFWNRRREIVALIAAARVPAIYPEREYVDEGGLMSYGANVPDNFRRAARYVHHILKGAKPGDRPIQEPSRLDFVINLKTARSLGITLPPDLLVRADEVIE
jgi:putative tryptophan/tyrosine transport system substrate-binding protein